MSNEYSAEFTGKWPARCIGEWKLYKDGQDISNLIPKELRNDPMWTYGEYDEWYFDENYLEDFRSYYDGLKQEEWIKDNKYWLDKISKDENDQNKIFKVINENDFRTGSCGGCI